MALYQNIVPTEFGPIVIQDSSASNQNMLPGYGYGGDNLPAVVGVVKDVFWFGGGA